MLVGQRIKELRKLKGLTQQEVGKRIGVTASFIGQYENGARSPKYETLKKIADAIGVSIYDLDPSLSLALDHPNFDALPPELKEEIIYSASGNMAIAEILAIYLSLSEDNKLYFNQLVDQHLLAYEENKGNSKQLQKSTFQCVDKKIEHLRKNLNESFDILTDEGKFVAVERVKELTEIPRYQRQPAATDDKTPPEGNDPTQD